MEEAEVPMKLLSLLLTLLVSSLLYLCHILWLKPERLRQKLRRQGVRGPKPSLLYGNMPDMRRIRQELIESEQKQQETNSYLSTLFPHYLQWRRTYGPVFMYSTGAMEILHVAQPDMVKEMGHCTSSQLGKPSYVRKTRRALLGEGILTANGDLWAYQRKIITPEFFVDKVKGMTNLIVEATIPLLEAWDGMLEKAGGSREIDVDGYLRNLSADVIARACFGSSFAKAEAIFCRLRQLQEAIAKSDASIGSMAVLWRCLPTKQSNREIEKLDGEIRALILDVVKEHSNGAPSSGSSDFLRTIVAGAGGGPVRPGAATDFIVDNCKSLYFAGHETNAVTAAWCLMLLAKHPEWQDRARTEALEVLQGGLPDADALRKLKTLTMVIQETLRLYPPASQVIREAMEDIDLGGLRVPKGTVLQIAIAVLHLDEASWGPDAGEFRPGRFAAGTAAACRPPHMYMPFGHGPRGCAGQNLAMAELRVVLSLLLARFAFAPAPSYRHSPALRVTVEPGLGMPLVVTRL